MALRIDFIILSDLYDKRRIAIPVREIRYILEKKTNAEIKIGKELVSVNESFEEICKKIQDIK